MATGALIASPDIFDRTVSANIDDYATPHWSVGGLAGNPAGGTHGDTQPVSEMGNAQTGGLVASFRDDYYDRIHVSPNPVELGNLLSDQVRDIEVWNAYESNQALTAITPANDDGLELTEPDPAPTTFGPLESRIYQLSVSTIGPAVIDASYTFDFPSDDPVLVVTGQRVVIWTFAPNWKHRLLERLAWLTDVLRAYDGTEQAIKLRQAPRRSFEFVPVTNDIDKQRLRAMLYDWQARVFALPVFTDRGHLTAAASVDDVVLYVNTDDLDYHSGGIAVLIKDTGTAEAVEVLSVASDSITLTRPLLGGWSAGSRIYPARLARMEDSLSLRHYTATLCDGAVRFHVEDNAAETAVDSSATYRGYPVLEDRPNWREDLSEEFQRKLYRLDNKTGLVNVDDESGLPVTIQSWLWTRSGRPAITSLRQWLAARAGRLNLIWVATEQRDLTVAATITAASATITIVNIGYARFLKQQIGRRDIRIKLKDGTVFYRRITGSNEIDASTETITLDAVLGQQVEPADVLIVSFMRLSRLGGDSVEFAWHNCATLECAHLMRGANDDL